jgi:hypothetical protein
VGARRISALVGAVAAILVAALSTPGGLAAQGAESSRVVCRLDPVTHVLTVKLEATRLGLSEVAIRRGGDVIEVSEGESRSKVACAGSPTVTNAERVELLTETGSLVPPEVEIELDGGLFGPGLTPEADDSSEIEFVVVGGGNVWVDGSHGADHFQYLTADGLTGLNLDPVAGDRDVDIGVQGKVQNLLPIFPRGGGGPDRIEVVGHLRAAVSAEGGSGDDILLASGAGIAVLRGQGGRDRIVGTPEYDVLLPGKGRDTVEGLGDEDLVHLRPDGQPDRIDCGAGDDEATGRPDPFDRLRSCEYVEGRGR